MSEQTEINRDALYALPLHECQLFECNYGTQLQVIRVAGGWIYQYIRLDANSMWAVFVPFSNEFMKSLESQIDDSHF